MAKRAHRGWAAPLAVALALTLAPGTPTLAQVATLGPQPVVHTISAANERLTMTVNTSRILTLDKKIPQVQVMNPDVLAAQPLAPNQVQISAKKPGVTQINLWDEAGQVYTTDVVVYGDARELEMILADEFPNCALRVKPISNGVLISGYVDQAGHVTSIQQIAGEYYPKVLTNIQVGGVHQVLLHVRAMEVSRTKLRELGVDWANLSGSDYVVSSVSGLLGAVATANPASGAGPGVSTVGLPTFQFGVVDGSNAFFGLIRALQQDNLAKVLSEPTLVTVSGRPAFFEVGGEFPIIVPQSLGTVSIDWKKFGTRVDFVPIVLGNGRIRLEVRPRVSEVDPTRSVTLNSLTVPGIRVREADTGVEMTAGQTLAIAGLVQERIEAQRRSLPWIGELPYIGVMFSSKQHERNEVELLILVTPELVEGLNPQDVPPCGPGTTTTTPSDWELYMRGYLEVPNCCPAPPSACVGSPAGTAVALPENLVPTPADGEAAPLPPQPRVEQPAAPSSPAPNAAPSEAPAPLPDAAAQGSSPRSLAAARMAMNPTRQNRVNPQNRPAGAGAAQPQELPGFIGPVGYEAARY